MSIESQIRNQVFKKLRSTAISVLPKINKYIEKSYRNQDFVGQIHSGILAADLGLTPSRAKAATESIIQDLISNTKAEFIAGSGNILGILRVKVKIHLSESVFTKNEYVSGKHKIPFLDWLLRRGGEILVFDYEVDYKTSAKSRSGMALMTEKEGTMFRIRPEYSGTVDDNIITRFLKSEVKDIQKIMISEIKRNLHN